MRVEARGEGALVEVELDSGELGFVLVLPGGVTELLEEEVVLGVGVERYAISIETATGTRCSLISTFGGGCAERTDWVQYVVYTVNGAGRTELAHLNDESFSGFDSAAPPIAYPAGPMRLLLDLQGLYALP